MINRQRREFGRGPHVPKQQHIDLDCVYSYLVYFYETTKVVNAKFRQHLRETNYFEPRPFITTRSTTQPQLSKSVGQVVVAYSHKTIYLQTYKFKIWGYDKSKSCICRIQNQLLERKIKSQDFFGRKRKRKRKDNTNICRRAHAHTYI